MATTFLVLLWKASRVITNMTASYSSDSLALGILEWITSFRELRQRHTNVRHIKRYLLRSQLMPDVIMLMKPVRDALLGARLAGKYRGAHVGGPTSVPLQHFQQYYAR